MAPPKRKEILPSGVPCISKIRARWKQGFEAKYPFLKVDILRAGERQIVNRAVTQHMAGKTTYDVINAFALKVLQNRGLLQMHAAPDSRHYATGFKTPKILGL
ncbi:MAG TPA: hypothetical protein VLJ79_25920 [Candidatus Binatia bacterium]|nr:hypothetical protein [Candidatus Binatia bacterium]